MRWALLAIAVGVLVLQTAAWGQWPPTGEAGAGNTLPPNVQRIGTIETTIVKSHLDGRELFEIASPAVQNRANPGNSIPVEMRAQQIAAALERASRLLQDARAPAIVVAELNQLTVLQAIDRQQPKQRIRIVTVTSLDADFHGLEIEELASNWRNTLEDDFHRALRLYAPDEIARRTLRVLQILAIAILASAAIGLFQWLLHRFDQQRAAQRQRDLAAMESMAQAQAAQVDRNTAEPVKIEQVAVQQQRFLEKLRTRWQHDYRDNLVQLSHWLFFWLQIGLWYGAAIGIVSIHPLLMQWRGWILATPVNILFTWFFFSLAIRLSYVLIARFTRAWGRNDFLKGFLPLEEMQRKELRAATIAGVLRSVAFAVFVTWAIADTLEALGLSTRSLVAGGAILALAVSFGAQNLVKDLVNGFLILIEDQFAVGDVIDLGNASGLVEDLNLRVTQVRDSSGALITIPNSAITQVKNLTRLWSRVDFTIEIAYDADLRRALEILKEVGQQMFAEPEWRKRLLEVPDVLGVDSVAHTGMLLRVWIKTAPLEQWAVEREYRYRVRLAFEANGIAIGRPQWIAYNTRLPPVPTVEAAIAPESSESASSR